MSWNFPIYVHNGDISYDLRFQQLNVWIWFVWIQRVSILRTQICGISTVYECLIVYAYKPKKKLVTWHINKDEQHGDCSEQDSTRVYYLKCFIFCGLSRLNKSALREVFHILWFVKTQQECITRSVSYSVVCQDSTRVYYEKCFIFCGLSRLNKSALPEVLHILWFVNADRDPDLEFVWTMFTSLKVVPLRRLRRCCCGHQNYLWQSHQSRHSIIALPQPVSWYSIDGRLSWPRLPGNALAGSQTRDLSITSPTTEPQTNSVLAQKQIASIDQLCLPAVDQLQ